MLNEFDIIDKYFKNLTHNNLLVDIGDDAAVIDVRDIQDICITTDTLVAGTHFYLVLRLIVSVIKHWQ